MNLLIVYVFRYFLILNLIVMVRCSHFLGDAKYFIYSIIVPIIKYSNNLLPLSMIKFRGKIKVIKIKNRGKKSDCILYVIIHYCIHLLYSFFYLLLFMLKLKVFVIFKTLRVLFY